MDVGRLVRDILIADHNVSRGNNTKLNHRDNARDSITDRWLKKALTKKKITSTREGVGIYLPVVLKTLQKLRSNDNTPSYFTLLNKIRASDVTWISQSGKRIKNREEVPIEFYNEVSNMINRMSLNCSNFNDLCALADFSIKLMQGYRGLKVSTPSPDRPYETRFYKNCLSVVIRSESLLGLSKAFREIPNNQEGLKPLAELTFYHKTGQFIKVLDFLEGFILLSLADKSITKKQVNAFSTSLSNILQTCLINGEEEICNRFLKKLKNQWGYKLDEHSFTILKEICEKLGMDQVLLTIADKKEGIGKNILEKHMIWSEYIKSLNENGVDLFREELLFDYSQSILSNVGPHLDDWKTFIDSNPLPHDVNDSLKAFYVNSIMVNLSTKKNIGFMLSALEFLVYKRKLHQYLIFSHKILGSSKSAGFHSLIKSISNSESAQITAYTLHEFLKQHPNIGFQFNANDYYGLIKASTYKTDHNMIYYFLYQYLKDQGHTLYKGPESTEWHLPYHISKLLDQIHDSKFDKRTDEIKKDAKDFFIQRRLNNLQVDEDGLRKVFGEEYFPQITVETLLSLEETHKRSKSSLSSHSGYNSSLDLEYSRRLSNCVNFIIEHDPSTLS